MEIVTTILIVAGVLVALWILVSFISFILVLIAGRKITKSHIEAFNDFNHFNHVNDFNRRNR